MVYHFRDELIDISLDGADRLIAKHELDFLRPYRIYESVSYKKMLYSIKPLKIEHWYTEEQIKQMKGEE